MNIQMRQTIRAREEVKEAGSIQAAIESIDKQLANPIDAKHYRFMAGVLVYLLRLQVWKENGVITNDN